MTDCATAPNRPASRGPRCAHLDERGECAFAGGRASTGPTECKERRLPRPLRSSRTRNGTSCVSATRGLQGRFCACVKEA